MTVERHLILQEMTLQPSGEWTPQFRGWTVVRVAEGVAYWLQGGNAREFKAGDGFVCGANSDLLLRSSRLGALKLHFFNVHPEYINGILSVAERHKLQAATQGASPYMAIFTASEPVAQKFTRIVEHPIADGLSLRCALLQLWSSSLHGLMTVPASESAGANKLQERFRELLGKMTEAELAEASLHDLAGRLHCSERHFCRLFRVEYGVPLRTRQIELRLLRARQLLADSNAKVFNIAHESGYRHLGLFNSMFKKRFGVTPSKWRQQNLSPKSCASEQNPKTAGGSGDLSRRVGSLSTKRQAGCNPVSVAQSQARGDQIFCPENTGDPGIINPEAAAKVSKKRAFRSCQNKAA